MFKNHTLMNLCVCEDCKESEFKPLAIKEQNKLKPQ